MIVLKKPDYVVIKRWVGAGNRILLGLIFMAAGLGKIFITQADPTKVLFNPFPDFMASTFNTAIFTWLPRIELVIGALLIVGILVKPMLILSGTLSLAFIINNSYLLTRGLGYEPCSCFGILDRWLKAELSTTGSLVFDIVMMGMAFIILFWSKPGHFSIHLRQPKHRHPLASGDQLVESRNGAYPAK